jgi:hypothetical protein
MPQHVFAELIEDVVQPFVGSGWLGVFLPLTVWRIRACHPQSPESDHRRHSVTAVWIERERTRPSLLTNPASVA